MLFYPVGLIQIEISTLRSKEEICRADVRQITKEIEALEAKIKPYRARLGATEARLANLTDQIRECEQALSQLEG
jgi:chromosome segregation ATPase